MKRLSVVLLAGYFLLAQNIIAAEINTCAVCPDSTTFFSQHLNRTLPVHNLNEILLLSVATQSMHGADKTGVAYLVDGVDVSKLMYKNGALSPIGSFDQVNMNKNRLGVATGTWYSPMDNTHLNGRQSSMINTTIQLTQRETANVDVRAGTFSPEYPANGGVVNLHTQNGGNKLTASLNLRSSIGHLNHAGPNVYNNNPDHNPDILGGKSVAELYQQQRNYYLQSGEYNRMLGEEMTWFYDKYNYGDKPRINGDFTLGGSIGQKAKFFLAADILNDYGTLPAQFQRKIGTSLKLNYQLNPQNAFTLYGKIFDQGKIGGWVNRSYVHAHMFNPQNNPVHQGMGLMSYAKWHHQFTPTSQLETTLSYVGDFHTYGYKPIEKDGELVISADKTGKDWLIIDSEESYRKYVANRETRIFNAGIDSDWSRYLAGTGPWGIRFDIPYYYEDLATDRLGMSTVFSDASFPNQTISTGINYSLDSIRLLRKSYISTSQDHSYDSDVKISPWQAGIFVQDKISYRDIHATIGCRLDAWQTGTQTFSDPRDAISEEQLILFNSLVGHTWNYTGKNKVIMSVSPRIAVAHPVNKNLMMHYSWGQYTTIPDFTNLLNTYDSRLHYRSIFLQEQNIDPEKSTAWEMGLTFQPAASLGIDVTTYCRNSKNTDFLPFLIRDMPAYKIGYYDTDFGYRDNLGVEATLWKQPTGIRLGGIVELSGTLSMEYAYERTARDGAGMTTTGGVVSDVPWEDDWDLTIRPEDNYNFEETTFWPTYSRSNNTYWNLKAALRCDFPWQLGLSNIITFRSPWRYTQQLNVENTRYEKQLTGEYFLQWDLRAAKYLTFNHFQIKLYCDVLNVLDRENILTFDQFEKYYHFYEKKQVPWGPDWRATDQYGNLYTGIAREVYLGIELVLQ